MQILVLKAKSATLTDGYFNISILKHLPITYPV